MKTAISIPDPIFAEAEELARRLGKSRSQLFTEAVREYVVRHDPDAVTEAMNRLCDELDTHLDRALRGAAERRLRASEW